MQVQRRVGRRHVKREIAVGLLGASIVALGSLASLGCGAGMRPEGQAAGPIDGTWQTEGYGRLLEIAGESLQMFEVTTRYCMPAGTARRVAPEGGGTDPTFEHEDVGRFWLRPGSDADSRRIRFPGAASEIVIRRIAKRPERCDAGVANTPEHNFELFAETWAEHYILLEQKNIDWPAVVASARARVSPTTTPDELFAVFREMIAPLHDAHTFVSAPDLGKRFAAYRQGTERLIMGGREHFRTVQIPLITGITNGYLRAPIRQWCNGKVEYATIDDATGYLRILSFFGYADGPFEASLAALEAALDAVMTDLAGKQRLVIDVRINPGGADPLGLAIAARLTRREYLAYSKEARRDPVDRSKWTAGQPSMVRPTTRPSFHGEVIELIGPLTISAGETFTQALIGREPKVVRVGEATQGVFSDVLVRRLPNGWTFGLPNEVFRTVDGKTFDGPGIPPDFPVKVFSDADLEVGRDAALEWVGARRR